MLIPEIEMTKRQSRALVFRLSLLNRNWLFITNYDFNPTILTYVMKYPEVLRKALKGRSRWFWNEFENLEYPQVSIIRKKNPAMVTGSLENPFIYGGVTLKAVHPEEIL